ncbi:hypothetical protein NESM_000258300 [Novymonas esmeraldas]|uniref:Uncharacterized protein n=1 Tax=Novymonas esmeraldas TaxID=1808958 RepID=A0AAW0F6G4_9TRYP
MYRGKKQSRKAPAVAQEEVQRTDDAAVTLQSAGEMAAATPPAPPTHVATVQMKERFTAPFMVYDKQTRRIVANPLYDRALATELHRVQSILLTQLRTPLQAHLSYTPKELLYHVEASLYHVCASIAVSDDAAPLRYALGDAEADLVMPQLETFLAQHTAPAKTVVALAHCLSEGTSHDILASLLRTLEQRVQEELEPMVDRKRSTEERAALRATQNNLADVMQLVRDLQTAYRSIDTGSQVQRRQPQSDPTEVDVARSPAANAVPARMIEESFYKVLRWVVAVEADRRALQAATIAATTTTTTTITSAHAAAAEADGAAVSPLPAVVAAAATAPAVLGAAPSAVASTGFAKVVDYDPFTGRVTLERPDAAHRWGLLLNAKGMLVGLENALRHSGEAGERLFDAIQQRSGEAGGLAIYEVNRRRTRAVQLTSEELAAEGSAIMQRLRSSLTQQGTTLHLTIERRTHEDLTVPREVLFEVSYQGGEGGVGQRCLLMMERASTSISWGLRVKYLEGSPAVLTDFSTAAKLSDAAKTLLFDMRGRLRVLKINNQAMAKLSAAEMRSLVSGSLLLSLQLQVTDKHGEVPTETEAPAPATVAETTETAAAVTAGAMDTAPATAEAAEATEKVAAVEAAPAVDEAQVELDDAAAAIADDFLEKHDEAAAELDGSEAAEVKAAELTADDADPAAAAAAVESFEELEWARPTTTIGAPGDAEDDAKDVAADKAEAWMSESWPQPPGQLEEDHVEAKEVGDDEARVSELAAGDADGGEAPRVGTSEQDTTAEATELAEPRAKDGIEGALEEGEAETSKKRRGRPPSAASEAKKAKAAAAKNKKAKKKKAVRGGGRRKKDDAAADDDDGEQPGAEAVEGEEKDVAAAEVAPAPKKRGRVAAASAAAAAVEEGGDVEEAGTPKKRGRKPKASTVEKIEADSAEAAATATAEGDGTSSAATTTPPATTDTPLVELPPTAAEVAIEQGKKSAARPAKKNEPTAVEEEPEVPRVPLNQLLAAKPLTFENDVRLEKFDGSMLELERSSTSQPWNIKVAFAGDDIIMTKLPPFTPKHHAHPFLRSLGANPHGEVKWVVDGLNGQDLSIMSKSGKTRALDAIKGSTRLSFVLKALRR